MEADPACGRGILAGQLVAELDQCRDAQVVLVINGRWLRPYSVVARQDDKGPLGITQGSPLNEEDIYNEYAIGNRNEELEIEDRNGNSRYARFAQRAAGKRRIGWIERGVWNETTKGSMVAR